MPSVNDKRKTASSGLPLKPGAVRVTDVTAFEPWRTREGQWRPGKNGTAVPYASFGAFCEDLLEVLESRDVTTADDPHAQAAADRAERTLRTKQPDADPTLARRIAEIDAVKGGLPAFAPASFQGNTRSKETCERVTAYAADHDHETEESWAAAVTKLEALGVTWFAYGSPKDGLLGVRRRLLIALARDVTPAESARLRAIVPALLDLTPDASTVGDESRLFYAGTVDGAAPYVDGNPSADLALDVDALLAAHPAEPKPGKAKSKGRFGAVRPSPGDRRCPVGVEPAEHARTLALTSPPAVQGEGGHTTLFNLACDIVRGLGVDPADALAILWDVFNPRCEPPWEARERKDFDRKVSEAQHCDREHGYLLPDASAAAAAAYAPAAGAARDLTQPIFLITQDGKETWHFDPRTEAYTPFGPRALVTSLEQSGAAGLILMREGNRAYSPQTLIDNGPTMIVETVATDLRSACRAQWDRSAARVLLGVRCRAVEPKHDPDVDAWLKALALEQYDTVCTFIASCAQEHIDRPAIALAILGPDSIGKTVLAMALASMWNASHPVPLRAVIEKFNASMAKCAIVLDDECDALKAGLVSTESFRRIINDDSRDIEPKGQEKRTLLGCQRFIITGNDETDVHFSDAKPGAIKAMGERMAIVAVASERRAEIIALFERVHVPGTGRADMDRMRGHFAWIQSEWRAKIGMQRFIGSSAANATTAIAAMMRARVERFPGWFDALRDVLLGAVRIKGDCFVQGGKLLVRTELFAESVSVFGDYKRQYSGKDVRDAFSHASTGRHVVKVDGLAVTCMSLDPWLLARVLELDAAAVGRTLSGRRFGRALSGRRFGRAQS